jgi:hypothetical protein
MIVAAIIIASAILADGIWLVRRGGNPVAAVVEKSVAVLSR